jgi:hypothetical protein
MLFDEYAFAAAAGEKTGGGLLRISRRSHRACDRAGAGAQTSRFEAPTSNTGSMTAGGLADKDDPYHTRMPPTRKPPN